mmetsp:Transcript_2432/g.6875  ORF Transcript_2432/g.6875 Transcript_2432/m.6875 type:complete len:594 (-) Transcript_2432:405-2186(-)
MSFAGEGLWVAPRGHQASVQSGWTEESKTPDAPMADGAPHGGLRNVGIQMRVDAPEFKPSAGFMRADAPEFKPQGPPPQSATARPAAAKVRSAPRAAAASEAPETVGVSSGGRWRGREAGAGTSGLLFDLDSFLASGRDGTTTLTLKALALERGLGVPLAGGGPLRAQQIRSLQALLERAQRMQAQSPYFDHEPAKRPGLAAPHRTLKDLEETDARPSSATATATTLEALSESMSSGDEASPRSTSPGGAMLLGLLMQRDSRTHGRQRKRAVSDEVPPSGHRQQRFRRAVSGDVPPSGEVSLPRLVQGLLNKVCPENVDAIGEKLARIQVRTVGDLDSLAALLFKKALADSHYCDTYADLAFKLSSALPKFHVPGTAEPHSFHSALRATVVQELDSLPAASTFSKEDGVLLDAAELEFCRRQRKECMLANVRFAGRLFLRRLLPPGVVGDALVELTLCDNRDLLPEEHVLDCACELLLSIGYTLQEMQGGKKAIERVLGRLSELVQREGAYSKRIQFLVQDVVETRAAGWQRRVFKSSAKTKNDIRLEQQRDLVARRLGGAAEHYENIVAGKSPKYITEASRSAGKRPNFALQ